MPSLRVGDTPTAQLPEGEQGIAIWSLAPYADVWVSHDPGLSPRLVNTRPRTIRSPQDAS